MPEGAPVEVFIAVGSNIDPACNIVAAFERLQQHVRVTGVSTFYRTEPVGRPGQPSFLNGIWRIETTLSARDLKFGVLRAIEAELGRVRTDDRYAPRTIDLDIAVYGDQVIEALDLVVPDPDIIERPFLAVPLLELAPDMRLPGSAQPLRSLVSERGADSLEAARGLTRTLRERMVT